MNQITLLIFLVLAPVAIAGKSGNSDGRINAIEASRNEKMMEECNKSKDVDACLKTVQEEQDQNEQAVNVSGREKTGLKGK